MRAGPGTIGIPAVGRVTKANASSLLTEQLAAVAEFSRDLTADEDDWLEAFPTEQGRLLYGMGGLSVGRQRGCYVQA